jgi:ribonuclease G
MPGRRPPARNQHGEQEHDCRERGRGGDPRRAHRERDPLRDLRRARARPEPRRQHLSGQGHARPAGHAGGVRRHRPRPRSLPPRRGTPIRDVLREGQEVVVQVSKGPISTKGARVTQHVSLPGRYVVYMPTVDHIGVSKRIGNDKERKRLREVIDSIKPERGGLIVRTLSRGLTKKQLKTDIGYLVQLGDDIAAAEDRPSAPTLFYTELDIVAARRARRVHGGVDKIVIDDQRRATAPQAFVEQLHARARRTTWSSTTAPSPSSTSTASRTRSAGLSRKVPLPSRGLPHHRPGRGAHGHRRQHRPLHVGKGKDVEETIFQTNLEAVAGDRLPAALRNIGGLIVIDFIDMERSQNRERSTRRSSGPAQGQGQDHHVRISELGLVEMTRKRTRESLGRTLFEPCFYCDGTGHTLVEQGHRLPRDPPADPPREGRPAGLQASWSTRTRRSCDTLEREEKDALDEASHGYAAADRAHAPPDYHLEQFDLGGGLMRARRIAAPERLRALRSEHEHPSPSRCDRWLGARGANSASPSTRSSSPSTRSSRSTSRTSRARECS